MLQNLEKYRLLLGSKSSRRAELLKLLEWEFEQIDINADESIPEDVPQAQAAEFLAVKKSNAYGDLRDDELLITADTIVLLGNEILGKPANAQEAHEMLRSLSGKKHQVITGICIRNNGATSSSSSNTVVNFKELSDEEIDFYVNTYKPFDKAGAYGIQEWIGGVAVESIDGSYYNVMGLPVHLLYKEMEEFLAR